MFARDDATAPQPTGLDERLADALLPPLVVSPPRGPGAQRAADPAGETSPRSQRIDADDLLQLVQEVPAIEAEVAPALFDGVPLEQFWIHADLTVHGHGLARQRATAALRRIMSDFDAVPELDAAGLERLVAALDAAEARGGGQLPLLFKTLRWAANRARRAARASAEGERL